MKPGRFSLSIELAPALVRRALESVRRAFRAPPAVRGDTPLEIAREVLRANAGKVLYAGSGSLRYMRAFDFGVSFRGMTKVLSPSYVRGQLEAMIRESFRQGRSPSCYSARRGFDYPRYRCDSLPLLVFSVAEYCRWVGDRRLLADHEAALQWLLSQYEAAHFHDGLLDPGQAGDWAEGFPRPSSTHANICALMMLRRARELGLHTHLDPGLLEKSLIERRLRGERFAAHEGAEASGPDAAAAALYFELFERRLRDALAQGLESGGPAPLPGPEGAPRLHLGLMAANGLKRAGRPYAAMKSAADALVMEARGFPETPGRRDAEHGLTMAAALYLELVLD